ncbi:AzlC family ABC transporter permease [Listeria booriae]|uniref:AzlC family ABC transporter permease n=1 Tax=Listeria booriae TaxID=1552123 RepID=A0A7X0ZVF7_9LIST|nr:AzlC family ABC transporter permease [Listeria booriae]MBC1209592.1 AzlC family ABC transporter permease [Listeria booriae]MBC1233018.1 AzlC family ABC transporter permease [Listeria booriae]MBC1245467.1 AzlC family ABC transporter permease [Listeria booriae]MBC1272184.1 AzlC family ABC transporter permease [Listeria booriae]MBC1306875.1 AzlC family ABC transporter permease [Listeria booriae]
MPEQVSEGSFLQGVKDCIPTLLGYISIGIAAGVAGIAANLNVLEVTLLAVFVYAGAAQFIICAMLLTNSTTLAIIVTTFIVNFRHFLLGATLAPHFQKDSMLKNIGISLLVTDESFGVAAMKLAKKEPMYAAWMNGLNITAYVVWIASCALGGMVGKLIPNPALFGLDFALTAMFVALFVFQLQSVPKSKLRHIAFLILYMLIFMIGLSFVVSSNVAVVLSTLIVATIGVVTDR